MQDMDDFWTWFRNKFVGFVQSKFPNVKPNLGQLMTAGESAGQYRLSLLSPGFLISYDCV